MTESKGDLPARAAALAARGQQAEAIAIYDVLVRDEPARAELHYNRAVLLYQSGARGPAEQAFLRAGMLRPRWGEPPLALGQLYSDARRYGDAERCFRIAVSLRPDFAAAHCNLAVTLMRLGRTVEALPWLRQARELEPADEAIWLLLRNALIEGGHDEEALEDFLRFEPRATLSAKVVGVGFAAARMMPGEAFERKFLRLALEWPYTSADTQVLGSVVAGLQYYDVAQEDLLRTYRAYDALMQAQRGGNPDLAAEWEALSPPSDRPLRVGYLSANFRNHVMGWIMLEVISRHDRARVEPHAYSIGELKHEDAITQAFRAQTATFVRLADSDDRAAAQRIADDRLDILVDLMSQSGGARPGILVHKPAPVIVEHLGLHGAIGLRQADFKITDDVADLPDAGRWQIEHPLPMRGAVIPIRRIAQAGRVESSPRPHSATVVFAAFTSLAKLSPRCLRAWRRIVDGVPGSVLLFSPYAEWEKKFYVRRAVSFGIDESRLRFVPAQQSEAVDRARYREVDIVLDAFPYTGGDSAAAALAEGVPFVTLCGRRHAERVATSILAHLGVTDTIAHTEDDYVAIAVALAQDSALREALAERIRAALPPDVASAMEPYTQNFEEALESAIRRHSGATK